MSPDDGLLTRQNSAEDAQGWKDDDLNGRYTGINSTFLAAYWTQNIQNVSQELVVLLQEQNFADGITQARYASNSTTSSMPWTVDKFGFSHPSGSTFALALVSYRVGKHLMLYTVDDNKTLQQHEYIISVTEPPDTNISLTSSTG